MKHKKKNFDFAKKKKNKNPVCISKTLTSSIQVVEIDLFKKNCQISHMMDLYIFEKVYYLKKNTTSIHIVVQFLIYFIHCKNYGEEFVNFTNANGNALQRFYFEFRQMWFSCVY